MFIIRECDEKWIGEYRPAFVKTDLVFGKINSCFVFIPFELVKQVVPELHAPNYTASERYFSRIDQCAPAVV